MPDTSSTKGYCSLIHQEKRNNGESENNDNYKRRREENEHQQTTKQPNREPLPVSNLEPLRRSRRIRAKQILREQIARDELPKSTQAQRQQSPGEVSTLFHNPLSPALANAANREEDVVNLKRQTTKRQRTLNSEDEPNRRVKSPRQESTLNIEPDLASTKHSFILKWLADSSWSRQATGTQPADSCDGSISMPGKSLSSLGDSIARTDSMSKRTGSSNARVQDADYRQSLRLRNIYIEREDPPSAFMQRAKRIISRPRASPDMDDAAIQELINKSRRLQEDAEEELVQQLAPGIITAMSGTFDLRIARNANQVWHNAVPVALDSSVLTQPIPLPRPKPDIAFGYPETAFSRDQLGTIDLLVDDKFGQSYAVPDQKLRFPFLAVEFTSQAKNGNHFIATNQVADAGAIAMNGDFELTARAFGQGFYDDTEPKFFSLTMDYDLARINVHWLKAPSQKEQRSFHVERLSQHLLDDPEGIRKLVRAVKNILDYGSDARLRSFCLALDAYRENFVREREAEREEAEREEAEREEAEREEAEREEAEREEAEREEAEREAAEREGFADQQHLDQQFSGPAVQPSCPTELRCE